MDTLTIILIAAAVAAMAWAVTYIATGAAGAPKRKLQQRLTTQGRVQTAGGAHQSIRLLDDVNDLGGFSKLPTAQLIRQRLAQAFPRLSIKVFLAISLGLGAIGAFVCFTLTGAAVPSTVLGFVGAYLPFFVALRKRASWSRKINSQIPDALDFLSRVLRAGQSLSTGLQMMSEELPQPLAGEFGRCYDQHGLGQPLDEGLREMAVRLESQDFAFFVTAVIIQRQSGGDLAEVLKNISTMIRQRLRLVQSVRAKTAEGRLTGYIMVAFPVVMFVLSYALNPERGGLLIHTSQGKMLISVATGLVIFGLFLIRRITTVRV
ncbi:MAG TPA: type II secretion system F family protein [Tepidisphaeraceae bacterium]|jgi:tight adherence protein B